MSTAFLVAGLGFGDEGKGTTVDCLVRRHNAKLVCRFNGGAQAAHNVVTDDGRHHTFAQFGSGTFVPGCATHLSRFMLVNPIFMMSEEKHLREVGVTDAFERLTIERDTLITNPFQVASNRLRELVRGRERHGSCGMGIGETVSDAISLRKMGFPPLSVNDLDKPDVLRAKLDASRREKRFTTPVGLDEHRQEWRILDDKTAVDDCVDRYREFAKRVHIVSKNYLDSRLRESDVVFEGAQGVLLDETYGFQPYTTWTDCTFKNALALLNDTPNTHGVRRIGVIRALPTRHGAGPFVTESPELSTEGDHNVFTPWQQNLRVGHFDAVTAHYAKDVLGGLDEIVLTHLDKLNYADARIYTNYDVPGPFNLRLHRIPYVHQPSLKRQTDVATGLNDMRPGTCVLTSCEDDFVGCIEGIFDAPVTIRSYGPCFKDKKATR